MRKPIGNTAPWFARLPSFLMPWGKRLNQSKLRIERMDRRTNMLSSGIPFFIILTSSIAVTTLVIDKQFELRDYRVRSIGLREMTLEDENRRLSEFLAKTDNVQELDNSVPLPTRELEPRL